MWILKKKKKKQTKEKTKKKTKTLTPLSPSIDNTATLSLNYLYPSTIPKPNAFSNHL